MGGIGIFSGRNLLLTALLVVILSGCSSRFLYNQLDTFVVWKVKDYVSLNSEQEAAVRSDVQQLLEYARQTEMPRIAELFSKAATDVRSGNLSAATMDSYYQQMLLIYDELMVALVPAAQRLLSSLEPEQIDELFGNLEEINAEMYEEYSGSTPEIREANRNKSAVKSIQRYTGRLSSEQKAFVHAELARMNDASEQWIAYQRDWQQRFRRLVEHPPESAAYTDDLTRLLLYPRDIHSAEYRARVDANRKILNDMLAELFNGLSERQSARMVRKLESYADRLNKLAAAG